MSSPADEDTLHPDDAAFALQYDDTVPGENPASAVSVATLTRTIKDVLEGAFPPIWVKGEVTDFKQHRNGHWYFVLRDKEASVRCVVWARDTRRV
ncbi:MAG: exodeoxyribonuclease VII large subunit, partial [Gemmatimonadaceae bacterium]